MNEPLAALLFAVRQAAVALIIAVDAAAQEPEVPPAQDAPCAHPEGKRRPMMGGRVFCMGCNKTIT